MLSTDGNDDWDVQHIVIVAHSLGGLPALCVAQALSHRLVGFVAVGAAIPRSGKSFMSVLPIPKRWLLPFVLRKWGTRPPESAIRSGLCNDLAPEQADDVVRSFVPESLRIYTAPVHALPPTVPKLSPQSVRILDTGHLPMLSDPDGLRTVLHGFVGELVAKPSANHSVDRQ